MLGYERYGSISLWRHLRALLLICFDRFGYKKVLDAVLRLGFAYCKPDLDDEIPF